MAIRGYVDGMIGGYVTGWAVAEPDHGNCEITVLDPGGEVIARGRASRHRPDLAVLALGRTSLAFRIAVHCPQERQSLRVLADDVELRGSPVPVGGGLYDSDCGIAGGTLTGWITERVTGFEAPMITVINQYGAKVGESPSLLNNSDPDPFSVQARFSIQLADQCFGAGEMRLDLLANGQKFSQRSCNLQIAGNLENVTAETCTGWLLSPDQPQRAFEINVYRDGVLAGTATCDIAREDVRGQYPNCGTPGFFMTLPKLKSSILHATTISLRFPNSDAELFEGPYVIGSRPAAVAAAQRAAQLGYKGLTGIGAVERAVIQMALSEFLERSRAGGGFVASLQPDPMLPPGSRPRITIIIPVYRGVEVTRNCILSVLAHRNAVTDQVVLVNDASPEPEMAKMLGSFAGQPNLCLMTNEQNLGFVQTVNRGLSFAAGGDVLFLNADTVLFPGGLDEICRVAYAAAEIGTVTAMSNNATIFSYPHPSLCKERLPDIGWPDLAAAALVANAGVVVDVPTGHGFCMFVKGEVLRRTGPLDEGFGRGYGEENDLCQRAADLGYRHVAAGGVIVEHRESISFVGEKASLMAANLPKLNRMYPEFTPVIMEFEREDGLRRARWALDKVRLRRAAEAGARFVLVVSNTHDGGTIKAISDIERISENYWGAVKLSLLARPDGFLELKCDAPSLLAIFAPREVEELFDVLSSAKPKQVFVHQLLGYPASFIDSLGIWANALHTVYYLHDFYPICPRVTMIDAVGRFCDVADAQTCARCVQMDGAHATSKLTELTPAAHRELFGDLLHGFRHVVAPSANAAGYVQRVFPELAIQSVPHPEPVEQVVPAARAGGDDEVVLMGAIGAHKGSGKLLEIAQRARLTHPHLHFRVIGFTNIDRQLSAVGNVTITGRYKPEQLPGLVAQARGRLALFLQSWPETYSYTLSEAAQYGFIPLVPDIGAPAARVRDAKYGIVFPFPVNAEQVLGVIEDVRTGRVKPFAKGVTPGRLFPDEDDIGKTRQILGRAEVRAAAVALQA